MILSVSRRTDIACYYSEWFMNRIRAGYVLTRNPMNHSQLSRIPLTPDVVDCIVFWTKDSSNLLSRLDELDEQAFKYYFQFTITPYDNSLEKFLRPKEDIMSSFIELSNRIGRERVVWRFDPIVVNDVFTVEYNKTQFERMCDRLAPFTDTVTISFVDMYKLKTQCLREITENEVAELSGFIGRCAEKYGLHAVACCEQNLTEYGIEKASCIDKSRIEKIIGYNLDIKSDKNQRKDCGCYESIDIGSYNTCMNGCVYCYANNSIATTRRRYQSHNPNSELLIGSVKETEKIIDKKVKSNITITLL